MDTTDDIAGIAADAARRLHFVGLAGSGMSALAQYRVLGGARTSGSDRGFDQGALEDEASRCRGLGIQVFPQDGSGVPGAAAVVTSTAVESGVPDLAAARALGVPVVHRAALLGHFVRTRPSIAIAGTSGKSTVTAMTFEVLAGAGHDPGLVTGGDLRSLATRGLRGNAWRGSGPLVIEADESDGSLDQHAPAVGVVLNLHRDHMEPAKALELFDSFARRCRTRALVSDDPELATLRPLATTFGFGSDAQWRGRDLVLDPERSRFVFDGAEVVVPAPGEHNARNAIAALAAARACGLDPAAAAAALRGFQGVSRRFEVAGRPRGITVVDDFAHNPRKVAAALQAAQRLSGRVLALFQPHGFAPARFMRRELASALASTLRAEDRFWFAPVFFAGGTVARDVDAGDLAAEARALGAPAEALARREDWVPLLRGLARPGDLVLVMGARDPALGTFARAVASSLESIPL